MSAPSFVDAGGYHQDPIDDGGRGEGVISAPTTPRNWGAALFFAFSNVAGQDFSRVRYRTALHEIEAEKLLRFENSSRVLSAWIAPLRWWQADEDGHFVFEWSGAQPITQGWMTLENVRYSDALRASDQLAHSNTFSSTVAMDAATGLVVTAINVGRDYDPNSGGVQRYDAVDEGDGNTSLGLSTDLTETGGTNTWGWSHTGTSSTGIAIALSIWGSESPEPRELRFARRGRHGLLVPSGYSL